MLVFVFAFLLAGGSLHRFTVSSSGSAGGPRSPGRQDFPNIVVRSIPFNDPNAPRTAMRVLAERRVYTSGGPRSPGPLWMPSPSRGFPQGPPPGSAPSVLPSLTPPTRQGQGRHRSGASPSGGDSRAGSALRSSGGGSSAHPRPRGQSRGSPPCHSRGTGHKLNKSHLPEHLSSSLRETASKRLAQTILDVANMARRLTDSEPAVVNVVSGSALPRPPRSRGEAEFAAGLFTERSAKARTSAGGARSADARWGHGADGT